MSLPVNAFGGLTNPPGKGKSITPPPSSALLKEDGGLLLKEDGGKILLD
jgi:hypothetical protein